MSYSPVPLSIVIPSRNSAATITACLRSILEATAQQECEIVVVDNGSSDSTLEQVRALGIRLEIVPPSFVSASRNHGARLARHPLVTFVDSDCIVRHSWLAGVQAAFSDPTVAVAGCRHEIRDDSTWVERAWQLARGRPEEEAADVPYVPAGNLAIRRAVFLEAGGFDETLETGEDPDLCKRIAALGHRVIESTEIRCVHLGEPRTLGAVFRRERWHGRGARLRYATGRLAPVTLSTMVFGAALASTPVGLVTAAAGFPWLAAAPLLAAIVPLTYAARYARPPRLLHFTQLVAIYSAYFLGRAAALPVVFLRLGLARGRSAREPGRHQPRSPPTRDES